ncbi:RDD family protein [Streptosporangium sp. NPDC000396]|uniref:RDD family protein n=1 Tax=Streptosporangium sp. NPDC000396 TaxID=3366185 RepID=UPI00369E705C
MKTAPPALTTRTLAARRHRFAAFLIDSLICYVATSPIHPLLEDVEVPDESVLISYLNPYAGNPDWPIDVALAVLFAAYFWLQHALWGQTLGKRLCRLKVVSSVTGEPPGLRRAGIRALVHPAMTSVPYIGVLLNLVDLLWMFGDSKRRCLHDVIAETIVVDLGGPEKKGFGGSGFLLGLGIIIALFAVFVLVSVLMAW